MNRFIKRIATALMTIPLILQSPLLAIAETKGDDIESNGTGSGWHTGPSTVERVAQCH